MTAYRIASHLYKARYPIIVYYVRRKGQQYQSLSYTKVLSKSDVDMMAITKYARTVHTGSDPQQQPGQPEAAHGSPPHPAVMNPRLSIVVYLCCSPYLPINPVHHLTIGAENHHHHYMPPAGSSITKSHHFVISLRSDERICY